GDDLAEDSVLAVEPRTGVRRDDEELGAVRVRAGIGHRESTSRDGMVLELVARPARSVSSRTTALDHEIGKDPVEGESVVEALASEVREVLDGARGVLGEELEFYRAFARVPAA